MAVDRDVHGAAGSGEEPVWRLLQAAGMRRTPQREAIVAALDGAGAGVAAPILLERARRRAPGLGLRTLERTLALLCTSGAVDAVVSADGIVRYRMCGLGPHHHHLVCHRCGRVEDLADCDVGAWVAPQAAARGFVVDGHDLTVHGVCADCHTPPPR